MDKKILYAFRTHILMIFREIIAGAKPNIDNERVTDEHCHLVLKVLKDDLETQNKFVEAAKLFDEARVHWVKDLKRDQFRIKDIKDFTDLLLTKIRNVTTVTTDLVEDENHRYTGKIVKIFRDKFRSQCGFIERKPDNIFFHSSAAKGINLIGKEGSLVSYKVTTNPKSGQLIAVDVEIE